jgi:hypothetical protein
MSEWQPIETAPRNGKWILVSGFKTRRKGPVSHICVVAAYFPISIFKPEAGYQWYYGTRGEEFVKEPTHWMELPEIPAEIKKPPKVKNYIEVVVYNKQKGKPKKTTISQKPTHKPG